MLSSGCLIQVKILSYVNSMSSIPVVISYESLHPRVDLFDNVGGIFQFHGEVVQSSQLVDGVALQRDVHSDASTTEGKVTLVGREPLVQIRVCSKQINVISCSMYDVLNMEVSSPGHTGYKNSKWSQF